MRKRLNMIFLVAISLIVAGCTNAVQSRHIAMQTTAAKPIQSQNFALQIKKLTEKLKQQGIQVIKVGEIISIVIPSDPLFEGESANLSPSAFFRLNLVADYMRLYAKTFVEVAGYTGNTECLASQKTEDYLQRNKSLTSQQAAQIVHYLWSKGIDTRMLNSVGYGCAYPIIDDSTANASIRNRRIEILFQYNK